MPENILNYPRNFSIGFIGLGISNMPVAKMLKDQGYAVSLRDKKVQPAIDGFDCFFGENYLSDIYENVLFLAPAVRPDLPELVKAKENGVIITNEVNEFLRLRKGRVIAVTGSDGKTTTTTLIYEILKASGVKVNLGGNIGANLLVNLENEDENTVTVCELSSFQLMKTRYAPDVAVITNISPNHLDWHKGMEEYIESKKNIFKFMQKGFCVLNADDKTSMSFTDEIPVKTVFISGEKRLDNGVWFDDNAIYLGNQKILDLKDIFIPGRHNVYNYSQAIAATCGYTTRYIIEETAKAFKGVPLRIQLVGELDGVKFYNSSIDSSPTRTAAALNSFNQKLIVIAGGYDKKIPLEPLGELFSKKAKHVVLMGTTAGKIDEILKKVNFTGAVKTVSSLEDAVNEAYSLANEGDIIILSPAAASFDMFKNFEERGDRFANIVANLIKTRHGKSV